MPSRGACFRTSENAVIIMSTCPAVFSRHFGPSSAISARSGAGISGIFTGFGAAFRCCGMASDIGLPVQEVGRVELNMRPIKGLDLMTLHRKSSGYSNKDNSILEPFVFNIDTLSFQPLHK